MQNHYQTADQQNVMNAHNIKNRLAAHPTLNFLTLSGDAVFADTWLQEMNPLEYALFAKPPRNGLTGLCDNMKLIIDVRTREEFVKEHIKGALNIPHYDLQFYADFLRDKEILLYCNTQNRSPIGQKKLADMGIESAVMSLQEQENYEWKENTIICVLNYVEIRDGQADAFMEKAAKLCRATESMDGFLGSKMLRADGISAIGSFVPGDLRDFEIKPDKMILLTFWTSKDAHEKSHHLSEFRDIFDQLPEHLTKMPYEEFYEVMK